MKEKSRVFGLLIVSFSLVLNVFAQDAIIKGIITDAAEFKDYIVKKEKTGNLRIGEYEVKSGDSYDTIIGKFTGK